jgi:DNA polymerase-1
MNEKLLLIDGNSILNRAFYGIKVLSNSKGEPTNAIYGFLNIMGKAIQEESATHLVVTFDLKAPTFRHKKYEAYKGKRKPMPDELRQQMPVLKELLKSMDIVICEMEGYEADDLLGTLSRKGEKKGMDVVILSGDRDMLQLATDKVKIAIPKTKQGTTTLEHYYTEDVRALYKVSPTEFIDIKGLMGDASDNIPGVPGIGEKTAIKIISQYKSIENAYAHVEELPTRQMNQLKENYDLAILSKELATICLDCPIDVAVEDCEMKKFYTEKSYGLFKNLEFKSYLDRFNETVNETVEETLKIVQLKSQEELNNCLANIKEISYNLFEDQTLMILTLMVDNQVVYYVDSNTVTVNEICKTLTEVLLDETIITITNNLKAQLHILGLDIPVNNQSIFDVSLGAYLISPINDSYNLDDIARSFTTIMLKSEEEIFGKGKSKKNCSEIESEQRINYFSQLAKVIHDCRQTIYTDLEENNLLSLYFDIELPLLYVLKSIEAEGVKVDAYGLKEYGDSLKVSILEVEERIYGYAGETFNINSPKQLGVILFEKLELPFSKKTKTGYSTAADVLDKLKNKHPIIEDIITYRHLTKLKSTYADGLFEYIKGDQRIHSTFNQKITSTGRISSMNPNLQNIPMKLEVGRKIRKVFVPKEGCVFIDADYSQIELRILAHLSGDETLIDAFNHELDIHSITASQVFHVPFEEVNSLQRRDAKAVNFGIVYGISAYGLSQDLNITRSEAADYIDRYFTKYPKVKTFLDKTIEEAKEKGYVTTMFNRIRPVPELNSSNFMQKSFGERIAMNTPIQGSAADVMKVAMINVYKQLKAGGYKSKLILQIHDELLIEAYEEEVEAVKALLVKEMQEAASLSVPLTVDVAVGHNWYDAK